MRCSKYHQSGILSIISFAGNGSVDAAFSGILYDGTVVSEVIQDNLSPQMVEGQPVRAQHLHDWGKQIRAAIKKEEIDFTITRSASQ